MRCVGPRWKERRGWRDLGFLGSFRKTRLSRVSGVSGVLNVLGVSIPGDVLEICVLADLVGLVESSLIGTWA